MARYQTGSLADYDNRWKQSADALYLEVQKSIKDRVVKLPGSYSVLGTRSEQRAGKIIIYEEGIGRGLRDELLRDGVYVLLRTNGDAEQAIWHGPLSSDPRFVSFFERMDQNRTMEIAPQYDETFAFFELKNEDLANAAVLLSEASRSLP